MARLTCSLEKGESGKRGKRNMPRREVSWGDLVCTAVLAQKPTVLLETSLSYLVSIPRVKRGTTRRFVCEHHYGQGQSTHQPPSIISGPRRDCCTLRFEVKPVPVLSPLVCCQQSVLRRNCFAEIGDWIGRRQLNDSAHEFWWLVWTSAM